ncbi:hypothetical protein M407DRAFT_77860, partial [Tulasnella calospora MUT 4182]
VRAVPTPPVHFFTEVVRRRKAPLYRHPCLHAADSPVGPYLNPEDGLITDGDDHEGMGSYAVLTAAVRNESGEGGWAEVVSGVAKEWLKRRRVEGEVGAEEADDRPGPSRQKRRIGEEEVDEREEEEEAELTSLKGSLTGLADRLQESANLLRSQIPHENITWMRSIRSELSVAWESKLAKLLEDIRHFERRGTVTTWPRNSKEQQASRHTMGYQLQSTWTIE